MANGDIAAGAGLPVVPPTKDIRMGYDDINALADAVADHIVNGSHAWSKVTGKPGSFPPSAHNHSADNVTSGTFSTARIPNLNASKITAGTLNINRVPTIPDNKLTTASGTISTVSNWTGSVSYRAGAGWVRLRADIERDALVNAGAGLVYVTGENSIPEAYAPLADEYGWAWMHVTSGNTVREWPLVVDRSSRRIYILVGSNSLAIPTATNFRFSITYPYA